MAVYDCCAFWQENDILEIRLNTHWNFVDKFIVVEAGETHSGVKKTFNFDQQRFEKYREKLVYVKFDNFADEMAKHPEYDCSIYNELRGWQANYRRDAFQAAYEIKTLKELGAQPNDIVYSSCLDEIINPSIFEQITEIFQNKDQTFDAKSALEFNHMGKLMPKNTMILENCRPIIWLEMQMFVYKMNLAYIENPGDAKWAAGTVSEFCNYERMMPATLRALNASTHPRIQNAGWHFTYMDDTETGEKILGKMRNWAHSDDMLPNGRRRADLASLNEAIEQIVGEFRLSIPESIINLSYETHPKYLVDNQHLYQKYILSL